jgi:hypothetical protein
MNVITSLVNRFLPTHKNSAGLTEARDFLNNGPRNVMTPDWSSLLIHEQDKYTGYMYAGITRRANKVAWLAKYNLKTTANEATTTAAKKDKKDLKHPYLDKIDESTTFSNGEFWRHIQTFIDLRGEYYLFVLRGKVGNAVGEIKEFKLIRPYNITVVYDAAGLEVVGYVETRGSQYREIEPHMIIPMKPLNPNDEQKPFGLADAAKDAQFTLKEASETMRATVRRNRKYSGVIHMGDGEVHIDPESVANLKSRMRNKSSNDEPTFTGGEKSSLAWVDMQTDMRKSDIQKVTEINLNEFGAVAGMSKTKLNIEQSGVTRDTADVQDDLFVADHAMPALELILEALNQDYKTNYPDEYKKTGYVLSIDSPLSEDKVSEQADVEISTSRFELYTTLINKGYDEDTAAAYASGAKDLTEIGKPKNPPIMPPIAPGAVTPADETPEEDTPSASKPGKAKTPPVKTKPASNGFILNQVSLADFPGLLDDVDMVPEKPGCIMLDTDALDVLTHVDGGKDDLVAATDMDDSVVPGEDVPHVTLLYGLLENGNIWKDKVDQVLEGWKLDGVTIDQVGSFDLGDSHAIVAHVKKTPEIIDGHERLTLLPHIQTHSEYMPHLTLAYVQHDQAVADKWVKALGKQYNGTTVKAKGINYGDEPATGAKNTASTGHDHQHAPAAIRNILDQGSKSVLEQQSASLKNTVINIERQMVSAVINKFSQNSFDKQSDIIDDQDRTDAQEALDTALVAFYVIAMSLNAASAMSRRTAEFSLPGTFTIDKEVNDYIKLIASRAAESHVNTVLEDLLNTIKETTERVVQDEVKKVIPKPGQTDEEILAFARKKALEGVGRERVISAIRTKYGETISKVRANTIARTESNRVYNRSQYEADRQFLTQNDLMGKAYKKWITRSGNPCPFCKAKAAEAPIPFRQAFAKVGDVLKATEEKEDGTLKLHQMKVGFEDCMAGEVHPNGECTYQLIIE